MPLKTDSSDKAPPPERIIAAGRRLFFRDRFEKVSTDRLAREAAVSKATIYKYFGDMAGVLRAVVETESITFAKGVPTNPASLKELRTCLTHYGTNLLTFLNDPEIIQFAQVMMEEARAHPDIAHDFYSVSYQRSHNVITGMFGLGLKGGFFRSALTAEELAEQLIGMWEGLRFTRAQLNLTEIPFENPADWSRKCVDTMLRL